MLRIFVKSKILHDKRGGSNIADHNCATSKSASEALRFVRITAWLRWRYWRFRLVCDAKIT
jgi:hypothetical protein